MHTSYATVSTPKASQYLRQLCKHFAHKLPTQFDETSGDIEFPFGHCTLASDSTALRLIADAPSAADLDRLTQVIGSHLERFAFRERPDLTWSDAARRDRANA